MRCYFDTEFTGLHQKTTLISIGCITESGNQFYAESTEYDRTQVDTWIQEHVLDNLLYNDVQKTDIIEETPTYFGMKGTETLIANHLELWLESATPAEMWSDCLSYDWVLFVQLWGHAFNLPTHIYYIPFDLCTALKLYGIDPDINREEFVGFSETERGKNKHNALWDAQVIKKCVEKLEKIPYV
jgi:hypothetical protein